MKIGVVGAGLVGSTSAYAMVMTGVGSEIVLVDKNEKRAQAEAYDISHAVPFAHRVRVTSGGYPDLARSRVVIVAAGVNQKPGEKRLELLKRNQSVFREVVPRILEYASDALLLVVTNPVDVMTHLATRFAEEHGIQRSKVLGSGTTLDTARFRSLLGAHFGVDPHHVHGYVIGEHGDSEVLTWSLVSVGVLPISQFCKMRCDLDGKTRETIDRKVRNSAYKIIEGKGATYYGIGSAVAHIVDAILNDYRAILTVTARTPEIEGVTDVTVSLPRLIGGEGILDTFLPPLDIGESEALKGSALTVKSAIQELDGAVSDHSPGHSASDSAGLNEPLFH
jgi:L-lactate dehydrogenase